MKVELTYDVENNEVLLQVHHSTGVTSLEATEMALWMLEQAMASMMDQPLEDGEAVC